MQTSISSSDIAIIVEGAIATLKLFAGAFVISVIAGLLIGLVRSGQSTAVLFPIRSLLALYSSLARGIPLLVQMLFLFYGLALLGYRLDRYVAASIALSAYGAASLSENIRAAIDSVPKGQWQAARMLGMSYFQILRFIIWPQALRLAIPPSVGTAALLMKGTALASVLGFVDVVRAGSIISMRTRSPLAAFTLVAISYLILVLPLLLISRRGFRHGPPAEPV